MSGQPPKSLNFWSGLMMKINNEVSGIISNFTKLLSRTSKIYEVAENAVHTEDLRTNDILHAIEIEGKTCADRSKMATMLRESRLDRRYYKDLLETYKPLYDFIQDKDNKRVLNKLNNVLGEVRKAEKYHENRTYKPRIDAMADLFKE